MLMVKNTPLEAKKADAPIDGRIMHSTEKFEAILLTLSPDEQIPAHGNDFDVLFTLMEGQALIKSDHQTFQLAPFETLFIPSGLSRALENPGSGQLKIMVFKVY